MGNKKSQLFSALVIGLPAWLLLTSCGIGSITINGIAGESAPAAEDPVDPALLTDTAFPRILIVTSPFSDTASVDPNTFNPDTAQTTIDDNLDGSHCSFDPSYFTRMESRPACFGPNVLFQSHPDGAGASGQLPGGDVGIWQANHTDGKACGVETLNQRMNGLSFRNLAATQTSSAILCVLNAAGIDIPFGASVDATEEMNALLTANTTITSATLTHATQPDGSDRYTYVFDLTYLGKPISGTLIHEPGEVAGDARGQISYRVDNTDNMLCGGISTTNQSLVYDTSGDNAEAEVRSAIFCGSQIDGFDERGRVDPEGLWNNNFNIFTANSDQHLGSGDYSYTWQAGPGDSHGRVLNSHADDDGTQTVSGAVFFGYGPTAEMADGSISGMICNWAGPGNQHNPQPSVQFQSVLRDGTRFIADASLIAYAPKNNCTYPGGGTFIWDRNANGSLADENAATPQPNGLQIPFDLNGDGQATIMERLEQEGYVPPVAPEPLD